MSSGVLTVTVAPAGWLGGSVDDRPDDQDPIGLVAGVDGVGQRAVEVDEVLLDAGAEHGEVELGVAAHERIERPRDPPEPASRRPRPLVLLEREAGPRAANARQHTGDVAVQGRLPVVDGEEAEAGADHLPVGAHRGHVAARVLDRPQQGRLDDRSRRAPHAVERGADQGEVGGRRRFPDLDLRHGGRRYPPRHGADPGHRRDRRRRARPPAERRPRGRRPARAVFRRAAHSRRRGPGAHHPLGNHRDRRGPRRRT